MECGTDDARIVEEVRSDDRRTERKLWEEPVALFTDSAADNEEIGPDEVFDGVEDAVNPLTPLVPLEVFALSCGIRCPRFCIFATNFNMWLSSATILSTNS